MVTAAAAPASRSPREEEQRAEELPVGLEVRLQLDTPGQLAPPQQLSSQRAGGLHLDRQVGQSQDAFVGVYETAAVLGAKEPRGPVHLVGDHQDLLSRPNPAHRSGVSEACCVTAATPLPDEGPGEVPHPLAHRRSWISMLRLPAAGRMLMREVYSMTPRSTSTTYFTMSRSRGGRDA